MRLLKMVLLAVPGLLILVVTSAFAGGECCTRGSLAVAGVPASAWNIELQYDYSSMKTIREGTESVTPDEVLDDQLMNGATRYSVPTKMVMQKYLLALNYRPGSSWRFTAAIPYLVNDMDMRMAMSGGSGMNGMGMSASTPVKSDSTMDRVQGIGDATFGALYTVLAPAAGAGGWDAAVGLGLKLPTGKNDVRHAGSDAMVHAMMQPGSGSWDPFFMVQGGWSAGKLSVRLNGTYQLATEGDEGYEYGDMIGADVVTRYQVAGAVSLGLGLSVLDTGKDTDHDGAYTKQTSMIDTTDNTGLTACYLTPEARISLPGTGGSLSLAFQQPIYQQVNGTQQVLDWRVLASVGWAF